MTPVALRCTPDRPPARRRAFSAFPAAVLLLLLPVAPPLPAQTTASQPNNIQLGEQALKANDQAAAATYFQKALERDPHNAEAHANLGAIAFFHGDCNTAEQNFRAALETAPGLTRVQALLAVCERRRNEPSATADLQAAFTKLDDPKLRLQIGMELANAWYQQGDFEKTATILHALLDLDPDNVDVLFFAQRVYSELADNTLNKLAVLSPGSARMEQLIAERLINAGDAKDAIVHYRKALQLGPRLPGLHYELAETLMEQDPNSADTQKEALSELKAATEVDGDSARVESQLGRIAMLQSDSAQAFVHFGRALALDHSDAQAQMGLAELYSQQGKPEEAVKYLKQVIAGDPLNAEAHYKLAQLDRRLHLEDESKHELQLFLQIRATQDKVKTLYREMAPPRPGPTDPTATR